MDRAISHAIVLDFEATCGNQEPIRPQEIIEFPSVLVALDTLKSVDEFSSFVRPFHNPHLTDFCRELTSITQEDVDGAPYFHEVLKAHENWIDSHGLTELNAVFVTCGDWDLGTMLPAQSRVGKKPVEYLRPIYTRWLNIKVPFASVAGRKAPGMAGMLRALEIELTGFHHRGIDDCRNIAKILRALVLSEAAVEATSALSPLKYPPIELRMRYGERVEILVLETRSLKALRELAGERFRCRITDFTRLDGERIEGGDQLRFLKSGEEILLASTV